MAEYFYTASKPVWPLGLKIAIFASAILLALSTFFYISSNRYADFTCPVVVETTAGAPVSIPVRVRNKGHSLMASTEGFFLSGEIAAEGQTTQTELPRAKVDLAPGRAGVYSLDFIAPPQAGNYLVRIDIVKEHEYWLSDKGNKPAYVRLVAKDGQ